MRGKLEKKRKKMEDTLISAVAACPVIYDPQCPFYRDSNRKELAWREVSKTIDVPVEICKKRWKGLRDMYMREKRKAMEKKSGSAASSQGKWRRFAVLSFLDPFITPRETSGNMTAAAAETCHHVDEEEEEFEETFDEGTEMEPPASSSAAAAASAPPPSPAADPSTSSAGPPKQKRKRSSTSSVEEEDRELQRVLLASLSKPPAPPPSAEESFLLSLVPMIQRLSLEKKEALLLDIHNLVYERTREAN
ncbi:transcription factor Adf-1-like [Synchiropus splendidus]|uniref:transcription factor Adf-1-like n=1 Tax=Synchiropus splendidus TaxID=270530 RepID=UPI00237EB130|nr:transcription factor Adf-1-like [Synchiropus splendidus]